MSLTAFVPYILAEREQNMRDDSYFWVTYWNPDEAKPELCQYGTTAGANCPGYPNPHELIAQTLPSVTAAAAAWQSAADRRRIAGLLMLEMEYGKMFVGDTVTVKRGRKVPKGITGKVVREETRTVHVSKYGTWKTKEQFLTLITDTGMWTVAAKNCSVVERGEVMQTLFDYSN